MNPTVERMSPWNANQTVSKLFARASEVPQSLVVAVFLFTEVLLFTTLRDAPYLSDPVNRSILVGLTGFLFFFTYLWESSTAGLPYRKFSGSALLVFLGAVFWYWTAHKQDQYLHAQIPLILSTLLLFGNAVHEEDKKIWDWQNRLFRTAIEATLAGMTFVASLFLIIFLIEFVFDTQVPRTVHEVISKAGATIVPALTFLIRIPTERPLLTKFGEGLIRYFILPLWLVYLFLLNIYGLKILIHWTLPKGMVSLPVCIAFVVYVMAWWGSLQIRSDAALQWPSPKLARIAKAMHVTLLLLMAAAIIRRIADYGITQPRFFLILLWLFFAGIVTLDFTPRLTGKRVALAFLVICLLSLIKVAGS